MNIKFRLTLMSFFQFFVWGAWLLTIGTYCLNAKGWGFDKFGAIFSTLALSSLFMPALTGIIADRWLNAEDFTAYCTYFMELFCFMCQK